jgi:hypothetical protein
MPSSRPNVDSALSSREVRSGMAPVALSTPEMRVSNPGRTPGAGAAARAVAALVAAASRRPTRSAGAMRTRGAPAGAASWITYRSPVCSGASNHRLPNASLVATSTVLPVRSRRLLTRLPPLGASHTSKV